jgi:hypothetical protein
VVRCYYVTAKLNSCYAVSTVLLRWLGNGEECKEYWIEVRSLCHNFTLIFVCFSLKSISRLEDNNLFNVLQYLIVSFRTLKGVSCWYWLCQVISQNPLPQFPFLLQFLSVFALRPDRSLATAGNKIQGLARRHCELLTVSSFTAPGFAYSIGLSLPPECAVHSRSVWAE